MIKARLSPRPDLPATIRKLPAPVPVGAKLSLVAAAQEDAVSIAPPLVQAPPPPQRPVVEPLTPERYRLQFTVGKATHDKLRRLQDLLAREIPDGDPAAIFDRALTVLLKEVEKKKLGAAAKPRTPRPQKPRSRHVPAHIRRAVNRRDGSRCAFVARDGRRCTETKFLEYHYVMPYAVDGEMSAENISLRCRAHNVYEAELIFGRFEPSLVREGPADYVAFGHGEQVPEPVTQAWTLRSAVTPARGTMSAPNQRSCSWTADTTVESTSQRCQARVVALRRATSNRRATAPLT